MAFGAIDGTLLAVNDAVCDFLGRPESELVGFTAMEFMHPDERDLAAANRDGLANATIESWRVERRFIRGDGRVVWGDVSTQAILGADGVPQYWQTVIIDITRPRASGIVRSSADAIVGRTLSGVITSWNAGAEALYGYKAEEAIGAELDALIPEDRQEELDEFTSRLAGGERIEPFETQRVLRGGSVADVSMTISPIRDASGVLIGTSTVAPRHHGTQASAGGTRCDDGTHAAVAALGEPRRTGRRRRARLQQPARGDPELHELRRRADARQRRRAGRSRADSRRRRSVRPTSRASC